jgi:hypothetical protein
MINKIRALILFVLLCGNVYADIEKVPTELNESTAPVVNENFRTLNDNVNKTRLKISNYFPGGVLGLENGGTGQDLTSGATGDTLYFSSPGTISLSSGHGIQVFTASGTFVVPNGITKIYISMAGGGGGGGRINASGGGGGGATTVINYPYTVTPNSSYSVVIGAGGAGSTSNGVAGTNGGTTSFDGTISAIGGSGGTAVGAGGAGGVGGYNASGSSGGLYRISGGNGDASPGNPDGGGGGGTAFGSGGRGGNAVTYATGVGFPGTANTGAGGGGGGTNSGGANGGAGADGICVIMY